MKSDTPETAPATEAPDLAIDLGNDGGVRKHVVREGTGSTPPLHSRCLVHYVGRISQTQEVFINTRQESNVSEPTMIVAGRDSIVNERGLHLAIATMRVGERAHVWVNPEYGWGTRGNFSFPTIPPNAALTYDIELLDFEPPAEGKSSRDLTYEERLEAADRRRLEGNAAYREGRYEDALTKYAAALSFVDEDMMMQLEGFHYDRAVAARTPAFLNMAACHIQLGDHRAAVTVTSQVLAEENGNAKALFRRGVARHALGQSEAAAADLTAALRASPDDAAIARELAAVKRTLAEERRAGASLFKGLVDKAGRENGLFGDDDNPEGDEGDGVDGGAVGGWLRRDSWLGGVLHALCPFIFGRDKIHAN